MQIFHVLTYSLVFQKDAISHLYQITEGDFAPNIWWEQREAHGKEM